MTVIDREKAYREVAETGRELLSLGLVARTWGNISAREDDTHFLITPSGLDYVGMTEDDIVSVDMTTGEYTGIHKPSGEKGVHKAAYESLRDVNFVIHTHQTYATALGLAGFDNMDITSEEVSELGGIAIAEYGLPGMKKLSEAVKKEIVKGAHVILMVHHGAIVCGRDKEEAMKRVNLLEKICKRNVRGQGGSKYIKMALDTEAEAGVLLDELKDKYEHIAFLNSPNIVKMSTVKRPVFAQMDDTAQMLGRTIPVGNAQRAKRLISNYDAVLVRGMGLLIKGRDKDDLDALMILAEKTAVGKLHADACKIRAQLSPTDCALMHFVYINKYSKKKGGK